MYMKHLYTQRHAAELGWISIERMQAFEFKSALSFPVPGCSFCLICIFMWAIGKCAVKPCVGGCTVKRSLCIHTHKQIKPQESCLFEQDLSLLVETEKQVNVSVLLMVLLFITYSKQIMGIGGQRQGCSYLFSVIPVLFCLFVLIIKIDRSQTDLNVKLFIYSFIHPSHLFLFGNIFQHFTHLLMH